MEIFAVEAGNSDSDYVQNTNSNHPKSVTGGGARTHDVSRRRSRSSGLRLGTIEALTEIVK